MKGNLSNFARRKGRMNAGLKMGKDRMMQKKTQQGQQGGFKAEVPEGCELGKERILVHCCCAPCSTAILEWMASQGLKPTIFFSNSNIVPADEYELRREELRRYATSLGMECIDDEYDHRAWLAAVKGLEKEPERGARCTVCFRFRLIRAARYAYENGYTLLTTTLASSRWKDLLQVNAAGAWAVEQVNRKAQQESRGLASGAFCPPSGQKVTWWAQNWRKGGLQARRNFLIKELNMYNQNWCGCEFSRNQ